MLRSLLLRPEKISANSDELANEAYLKLSTCNVTGLQLILQKWENTQACSDEFALCEAVNKIKHLIANDFTAFFQNAHELQWRQVV